MNNRDHIIILCNRDRKINKLEKENAKLKQELNIHIKMVADYVNERAEIIEEKEEAKAEVLILDRAISKMSEEYVLHGCIDCDRDETPECIRFICNKKCKEGFINEARKND